MDNRPIGFMDSGVGGLTVLKPLIKLLPAESYVFVGDQVNLPYGEKSFATVQKLTKRIADYLLTQNVKMLVIACNTATAAALDFVSARIPIPVIGVIAPGSEVAASVTSSGRIGVIATNGTVHSGIYEKQITAKNPTAVVSSLGCPDFVQLVEGGKVGTAETTTKVHDQLHFFDDKDIDTFVLGCTHFPALIEDFKSFFNDGVTIIDPGVATAKATVDYLTRHDMLTTSKETNGKRSFYTTGNPMTFQRVADTLLGRTITAEYLDI